MPATQERKSKRKKEKVEEILKEIELYYCTYSAECKED